MIEHNFQTLVERPIEEVFDFLVDLRNAPQWEPNCQQVEKTSEGPIGRGTSFLAKKGMGRLKSEIVDFERPARFATRDSGPGMTCGMVFRCDSKTGGTQVSGRLWMEPRGPMAALMLLMRPMMNRVLGELPEKLRRAIEAHGVGK